MAEQNYGFSSRTNLGVTNPDGTVNVRCRKCTRIICRVVPVPHQMMTSVPECAVCKGVPESAIKPRFFQPNPYAAPMAIDTSEPLILYEEEQEAYEDAKKNKHPWLGMFKPLYKVLFRGGEKNEPENIDDPDFKPSEEPKSRKVAKAKKSKGLFES